MSLNSEELVSVGGEGRGGGTNKERCSRILVFMGTMDMVDRFMEVGILINVNLENSN